MLHLINIDAFLRRLVFTTVVISTIAYYVIQYLIFPSFPVYKVIAIASVVTAALVAALFSPYVYRLGWKVARVLKWTGFYDLNGAWRGTIYPVGGKQIIVRAVIRQSLLGTQIDVHGETFKSATLLAAPMMEGGQYHVYYIYRSDPFNPNWGSYDGTARLALRTILTESGENLAFSGKYYTNRKTTGRIELMQSGADPTEDVSFY